MSEFFQIYAVENCAAGNIVPSLTKLRKHGSELKLFSNIHIIPISGMLFWNY